MAVVTGSGEAWEEEREREPTNTLWKAIAGTGERGMSREEHVGGWIHEVGANQLATWWFTNIHFASLISRFYFLSYLFSP